MDIQLSWINTGLHWSTNVDEFVKEFSQSETNIATITGKKKFDLLSKVYLDEKEKQTNESIAVLGNKRKKTKMNNKNDGNSMVAMDGEVLNERARKKKEEMKEKEEKKQIRLEKRERNKMIKDEKKN